MKINLLCTSSPSRPATHLSWRINGRQAPQDIVTRERPYMVQDGLLTQISRLTFVARPFHFQRGVLRVKCVAEISGNRLAHHTTILDNFRAWERSFQASGESLGVAPSLALMASCFTLCASFATSFSASFFFATSFAASFTDSIATSFVTSLKDSFITSLKNSFSTSSFRDSYTTSFSR
ncbi:putative CD80-like C2-set immunoglobulin domain-containing protein 5 [Homarus americanus]|uniref:Putative CD80-like C2-set immunoglobulin domain-containing protein 5 n=1 Tax=Homarus americanus TaxID=6706 RepID=A0A8J5JIH9_HOMAM|nr:putative CD80-like C2-set immunoglobulin domain-containing protein 5 [Homarus americanus]